MNIEPRVDELISVRRTLANDLREVLGQEGSQLRSRDFDALDRTVQHKTALMEQVEAQSRQLEQFLTETGVETAAPALTAALENT